MLDELPYLPGQLADAPAHLVQALLAPLDIQILCRPEQHQATIWATLTDTTPAAITALLTGPRTTITHTGPGQPATPAPAPDSESAQGPIWPELATIMNSGSCAVSARPDFRGISVEDGGAHGTARLSLGQGVSFAMTR